MNIKKTIIYKRTPLFIKTNTTNKENSQSGVRDAHESHFLDAAAVELAHRAVLVGLLLHGRIPRLRAVKQFVRICKSKREKFEMKTIQGLFLSKKLFTKSSIANKNKMEYVELMSPPATIYLYQCIRSCVAADTPAWHSHKCGTCLHPDPPCPPTTKK